MLYPASSRYNKAAKDFSKAQEIVRKFEDNVACFDQEDLFGSSTTSTSKAEAKPRTLNSNEPALHMMTKLTEWMENTTTAVQTMGSQMIGWERAQQSQMLLRPNFQPKRNFGFDRNRRTEDPKLHGHLKPTKMVEDEELCSSSSGEHMLSLYFLDHACLDHSDDISYRGDDDIIYAMDDGIFTMLGECMAEIKI